MAMQPVFRINGRTIHCDTGAIETPSGPVHLEPRVMDLLRYMAESGGRVVSRTDIIRDVWRGTLVTDDVITRSISQIRRALAEDWRRTPLIETIPKRGYRLIAEVDEGPLSGPTASAAPGASATPGPERQPMFAAFTETPTADLAETRAARHRAAASRKKRLLVGGTAAVLAISIVIVALTIVPRLSSSVLAPPGREPRMGSVMIAPFEPAGAGTDNDRLPAEMSEEVTELLGTSPEVRVIGTGSAIAWSRSGRSAIEGARELGVAALVTGTVRRSNKRLQVSISILDAATGRAVHSQSYQFPIDRSLLASRAIARDVARMLGGQVTLSPAAVEPPTASPTAYALFLEARYYLEMNEEGAIQQAIDYLRQATKLDPAFAEAHAALAVAIMLQVDFGNRSPGPLAPEAQREVDAAHALRPELPQVLAAQGLIHLYTGRFDEATHALRLATALMPNYAQAHMWLGLAGLSQWQMRKSIASFERALEIDPLSAIARENLGMALDFAGLHGRAEQELRRDLALHPQWANIHWALGHTLWEVGNLADARSEYETAIEHGVASPTLYAHMALIELSLDMPERAAQWILRGEAIDPRDEMLWLARAMMAAATNRLDELRVPEYRDESAAAAGRLHEHVYHEATLAIVFFYQHDFQSAQRHFTESRHREPSEEALLHSRWLAYAGHAPALDEAAAHILEGDTAAGQQMLNEFAGLLSSMRADGLQSAGMDYEEAAIAALQGDTTRASQWLQTARAHGWREDWYLMLDPKMRGVSGV